MNEATHEMFIPEDDIALVLPHIQLDVFEICANHCENCNDGEILILA